MCSRARCWCARAQAGARRPRCDRPAAQHARAGAGDGGPCLAAVRGSACPPWTEPPRAFGEAGAQDHADSVYGNVIQV
jgi:hypothetical protein